MLNDILEKMGVDITSYLEGELEVKSPIDATVLASIRCDDSSELERKIAQSVQAFDGWRTIPAPKRGELVRIFGQELREHKQALGQLVTLECGKILSEGLGEVQEMIDICDFAVGLSRQVGGLTLPSERSEHVMQENWLPLGPVGVISAFNFPVAVWAWNSAIALVCGDSVIWKPSEKTPITAIACQALLERAIEKFEQATSIAVPKDLSQITIGRADIGQQLVQDRRIALVSATGSSRMGSEVGPQVAQRFGRSLLELGGNNAVIVTPSASLDIALPSIVFGAVGTAGQRCTSTRRAFVHESILDEVKARLIRAYESLEDKIGHPLQEHILIGPLIDQSSFDAMQHVLAVAQSEAAEIIGGKRVIVPECEDGYYVNPALVFTDSQSEIVCTETFAPILYIMPYRDLHDALALQNDVEQGLSSAIFTSDVSEAEYFKRESDCGIANVNIGTSGAEIGGAFGGEKETGGGRESGSDAWKAYMRRQTSTTFYGKSAPELAQGVQFL